VGKAGEVEGEDSKDKIGKTTGREVERTGRTVEKGTGQKSQEKLGAQTEGGRLGWCETLKQSSSEKANSCC